jgi:hypothetical protein
MKPDVLCSADAKRSSCCRPGWRHQARPWPPEGIWSEEEADHVGSGPCGDFESPEGAVGEAEGRGKEVIAVSRSNEPTLSVPLTQRQVDAAERLHARMPQWQAANEALKVSDGTLSGLRLLCMSGQDRIAERSVRN